MSERFYSNATGRLTGLVYTRASDERGVRVAAETTKGRPAADACEPAGVWRETQADGTVYTFRLRPDGGVAIVRCETSAAVVVVPDTARGRAVTEIGEAAFAGLDHARIIVCPPQVSLVGKAAFAGCGQLAQLVLPARETRFDPTWISDCFALRALTLPDDLPRFAPTGLFSCAPTSLVVGAKTRMVRVPCAWRLSLADVAVSSKNPWLSADGCCLYNADGTVLIAGLTNASEISVRKGCTRIAPEAFAGDARLHAVVLPEGLASVGARAFAGSGLMRFEACESLRHVGAEAFAECKGLVDVRLNQGLISVGKRAFAGCRRLKALKVPRSVRHVGRSVAQGSGVKVVLQTGNRNLRLDAQGVLHRQYEGGWLLVDATDKGLGEYAIGRDVVAVGSHAFAGCVRMWSLSVSASVVRLGECALEGCDALADIRVDEGSRAFAVRNGVLFRLADEFAVFCTARAEEADLRGPAAGIARGAFVSADALRKLMIPASIRLEENALDFRRVPAEIVVEDMGSKAENWADCADPQVGSQAITVRPPSSAYARQAVREAQVGDWLDVRLLVAGCDAAISHLPFGRDRVERELARLCAPTLLGVDTGLTFRADLVSHLRLVCAMMAEAGKRAGFARLCDAEVITDRNIDSVIEWARRDGNVGALAYLLQLKHARFGCGSDYSL